MRFRGGRSWYGNRAQSGPAGFRAGGPRPGPGKIAQSVGVEPTEDEHDETFPGSSGRLVYGGHTIGLALHQATRALPGLVTVVGWHGCDHLGPVREGDTLTSSVEVEHVVPLASSASSDSSAFVSASASGGTLAHLRSLVSAASAGEPSTPVLDWRFVALLA
jgi:hypothetical protein